MAEQRAEYPLDYTEGPASAAGEARGTDRFREMADGAADQLKRVADNADEIAGRVAEQARVYGEKAQEVARNFKPYVEKSMKEQPMTTLAAAAAIGFALGALWKK
jgi:ElaB/YqjD/DUF883 family membrane-anchored ribosome-binding protein